MNTLRMEGVGIDNAILLVELNWGGEENKVTEVLVRIGVISLAGVSATKKCYVNSLDLSDFVAFARGNSAGDVAIYGEENDVFVHLNRTDRVVLEFNLKFMESNDATGGWGCQLKGEDIVLSGLNSWK